jgi:hypothetical protein
MRPEVGVRVAPCGVFISSSGGECNWWVVDECAKEKKRILTQRAQRKSSESTEKRKSNPRSQALRLAQGKQECLCHREGELFVGEGFDGIYAGSAESGDGGAEGGAD